LPIPSHPETRADSDVDADVDFKWVGRGGVFPPQT
jgi:hypothetical protein